ncbi:MAG: radical SAM protein [Thermodesulfobacteriota bacterium]
MRVAVIAPPYPLEEAPAPPLGVCYVAAAFERAGAEVRIFDFVVSEYSEKKLRALMDDFQPDLVGSTSVTMNFFQAAEIVRAAKRIRPETVAVMGGPHVSFWAKEALARYPELDLVVKGEGEGTIADLTPVLSDRAAWEKIPGLCFRKDGAVVDTGARELICDLDALPMPARHLLPLSRYQALGFPVSIITSRGCPNQCIFCLGRRMVGRKVRYRDPRLVVDEIEHLVSLGFGRINVADDLFTSNKERVAAVCDEIGRRGINVAWSAFSRVNTVDEETLRIMRKAGCDCVSFGIESGDPEMLKRIRKGITLDQARRAAELCKKTNMLAHASFMVGLPGETPESLATTEEFAVSLDIIYGYHFLAPFPGTTVYEDLKEYDLKVLTDDFSLYDANRPVVETSAVPASAAASFVKAHEDRCEKEWQRILDGYDKGTNTPDENLRVEGNRKLGLVFSILDYDFVEKYGAIRPEDLNNPVAALKPLVSAVTRETGKPPELVEKVLADFVRRGLLVVSRNGEGACFAWKENPAFARYEERPLSAAC